MSNGRGSPALADALARAGIGHVLLRHDLDAGVTTAPPRRTRRGRAPAERGPDPRPVLRRRRRSVAHRPLPRRAPRRRRRPHARRARGAVSGGPEDVIGLLEGDALAADRPTELVPTGTADLDAVGDAFQRRERQFGRTYDAVGPLLAPGESVPPGTTRPRLRRARGCRARHGLVTVGRPRDGILVVRLPGQRGTRTARARAGGRRRRLGRNDVALGAPAGPCRPVARGLPPETPAGRARRRLGGRGRLHRHPRAPGPGDRGRAERGAGDRPRERVRPRTPLRGPGVVAAGPRHGGPRQRTDRRGRVERGDGARGPSRTRSRTPRGRRGAGHRRALPGRPGSPRLYRHQRHLALRPRARPHGRRVHRPAPRVPYDRDGDVGTVAARRWPPRAQPLSSCSTRREVAPGCGHPPCSATTRSLRRPSPTTATLRPCGRARSGTPPPRSPCRGRASARSPASGSSSPAAPPACRARRSLASGDGCSRSPSTATASCPYPRSAPTR